MLKKIEAIEYDFGGDVFIDVGGNVGMWTKELYDLYGKILFIEPAANALKEAKETIQDSDQKIHYYKNICSNELNIKKSIYTPSTDSGQFSVFGKDLYSDDKIVMAEEDIDSITVDSLIPQVPEGSQVLLKIDTEGSDLDVLLGSFEFIKKFKPVIIMEVHFHMYFDDEKYVKIVEFFNEQGYVVTEHKYPGYMNDARRVFDGVHTGEEMYDLHYQVLMEPN
jgi:FkbM family methyltransferase